MICPNCGISELQVDEEYLFSQYGTTDLPFEDKVFYCDNPQCEEVFQGHELVNRNKGKK